MAAEEGASGAVEKQAAEASVCREMSPEEQNEARSERGVLVRGCLKLPLSLANGEVNVIHLEAAEGDSTLPDATQLRVGEHRYLVNQASGGYSIDLALTPSQGESENLVATLWLPETARANVRWERMLITPDHAYVEQSNTIDTSGAPQNAPAMGDTIEVEHPPQGFQSFACRQDRPCRRLVYPTTAFDENGRLRPGAAPTRSAAGTCVYDRVEVASWGSQSFGSSAGNEAGTLGSYCQVE